MTQPIIPVRDTTQNFTEIESIERDLVLFTDGSAALILSISAVNFDLLSDKEKDAIIYTYAGLLNSLSFPIQILVRTQHKDITAYLKLLEEQEKHQTNPKLAGNIRSYRTFVASTVKEKEVLDKKFYIIIPFSNLELGTSPNVLFGSKKRGLPYPQEYILDKAITILAPKRDQIVRLLARVGLRAHQLNNEQIAKLFFGIYNPGQPLPDLTDIFKIVVVGANKNLASV